MNKIILNNDLVGLNINQWYHYQFDTIVVCKLFESMMVDKDSYLSKIYNNYTYNMSGVMSPDIAMLLSEVIKNRDMKFAILNMNHSDKRIRSVCKFIIATRGVYEIE